MKTKALDIHPGLPWIDEYIDIELNGSPALKETYEVQLQILDQSTFEILVSASVPGDSTVDGRYWPSLSAAQTTSIADTDSFYQFLMREITSPLVIRIISEGEVNLTYSSSWDE